MGVLFFVLAAFALSLPKSGKWMEYVKSVGGIGLLFAAIYYLLPFVPQLKSVVKPELWFLFASIGLAVAGIAAGAIHLSFHGTWPERIRKGVAVTLVLFGALGVWMWKLTPKQHLPYEHDETSGVREGARPAQGGDGRFRRRVVQPVQGDGARVRRRRCLRGDHANFVPLKFDVTADTDVNAAAKARYGAETLPSVVFMDPDGTVLQRIRKETEADEMLEVVKRAAAHETVASNPCQR